MTYDRFKRGALLTKASSQLKVSRRTLYKWLSEGITEEKIKEYVKELGEGCLTPLELADSYNVSVMTIYRRISSGELDALKLGGGDKGPWRIPSRSIRKSE